MWVLVTSSCKLPYSCERELICLWIWTTLSVLCILAAECDFSGNNYSSWNRTSRYEKVFVLSTCTLCCIIYGNSAYQLRSVLSKLTIPTAGSADGYKGAWGAIWVRQWCHCDLIWLILWRRIIFLWRKNISADILHPNRNFSRVETELGLAGVLDGTLWESVFRAKL